MRERVKRAMFSVFLKFYPARRADSALKYSSPKAEVTIQRCDRICSVQTSVAVFPEIFLEVGDRFVHGHVRVFVVTQQIGGH